MPTKKVETEKSNIQPETGNQEMKDQETGDFFAKRVENKQWEINNYIFNV